MKSDDLKKITTKTVAELQTQVKSLQTELVDLRMQRALRKLKNTRLYKTKRQDLARVLTLLKVKQMPS